MSQCFIIGCYDSDKRSVGRACTRGENENYGANLIYGWSLNRNRCGFAEIFEYIFKELASEVKLDEMIRTCIEVLLNFSDLFSSLLYLCDPCKAGCLIA